MNAQELARRRCTLHPECGRPGSSSVGTHTGLGRSQGAKHLIRRRARGRAHSVTSLERRTTRSAAVPAAVPAAATSACARVLENPEPPGLSGVAAPGDGRISLERTTARSAAVPAAAASACARVFGNPEAPGISCIAAPGTGALRRDRLTNQDRRTITIRSQSSSGLHQVRGCSAVMS